jgi:uncharacterized protein with ParB-like and HNH nuclease domain
MEKENVRSGETDLRGLMRDWNRGDIQVPPFKRAYVWKIRKTLNLLDSLYRRFVEKRWLRGISQGPRQAFGWQVQSMAPAYQVIFTIET